MTYFVKALVLTSLLFIAKEGLQATPEKNIPKHRDSKTLPKSTVVHEISIPLNQIESYLNELTTLKASFKQLNPDGTVHEGLFFLSRPGKMRLKYKPPVNQVIISDGHFLIFHNPDLDEVTHIPLESTPAELLVKARVNLKKDARILETGSTGTHYFVKVARPDDLEAGTLTLVFDQSPLTLREWIIEDQNQRITHVILDHVQKDISLPEALFIYSNH